MSHKAAPLSCHWWLKFKILSIFSGDWNWRKPECPFNALRMLKNFTTKFASYLTLPDLHASRHGNGLPRTLALCLPPTLPHSMTMELLQRTLALATLQKRICESQSLRQKCIFMLEICKSYDLLCINLRASATFFMDTLHCHFRMLKRYQVAVNLCLMGTQQNLDAAWESLKPGEQERKLTYGYACARV